MYWIENHTIETEWLEAANPYAVIDTAKGGEEIERHPTRDAAMEAAARRNTPEDPNRYRATTAGAHGN